MLKINNICDSEHLADCGLPAQIVNAAGSKIDMPATAKALSAKLVRGIEPVYNHLDTKTVGFETANGESINVVYMPDCKPAMNETAYHLTQSKVCALMLYDLNGSKGPNTIGKDIGLMSVFYPTDSVVSLVQPYQRRSPDTITYDEAVQYCRNLDDGNYRLPTKEEAASIVYGTTLYQTGNGLMWTSTPIQVSGAVQYWVQGFGGDVTPVSKNSTFYAWCVKRF